MAKTRKIKPTVEIYIAPRRKASAAAGTSGDTKLSPEQMSAIQTTLNQLVSGFQPPTQSKSKQGHLALEEVELEVGFSVETGTGSLLKLLVDGKAEASITAKVVWRVAQ